MRKAMLVMAAALLMLIPTSASAAGRRFVGGHVFIGGGYWGPGYWGPYWGPGPYYWGPAYYGYQNSGEVKLDTKVKDAQVFINGAYAGTTQEDKKMHLRPGTYNFETDPAAALLDPSGDRDRLRAGRPDGGIVTTYTDITQTVQTEEALEAANEFLERRVDERTSELQRLNAELERAKTLAEEANLSKTRFLAAASHDILQPLNAARLYASSLQRPRPRPEAPSARTSRATSTFRSRRSRRSSAPCSTFRGSTPARPGQRSPTFRSPTSCICWRSSSLRSPGRKGLELRFAPTSLAIRTDRRLMRRLLQNLVSNALKYTLKGRVLVGCRHSGGAARIEVWDTGLGIPTDRQRVVFEEFQRLDQGARVARGLGLGLSIVERLSRVLGHPVGLNSTPGEGSVFSWSPRPWGKPRCRRRRGRRSARRRPRRAAERPEKILAIDNEPRVLEGMRALLSRWGCAVATAHDLAKAREALKTAGAPDVVIADYHLDESDGIEAIRTLRGELGRFVPAILATAEAGAPKSETARPARTS